MDVFIVQVNFLMFASGLRVDNVVMALLRGYNVEITASTWNRPYNNRP